MMNSAATAIENQIYQYCMRYDEPRYLDEARALIEQHGVDINADRFGRYPLDPLEPLLHAVARFGAYAAYRMLRTVGADPAKRNADGNNALYVALDNRGGRRMPQFTLAELRALLDEDPRLGLAATEALTRDYLRRGRAHDVQHMICDGVLPFHTGARLTHVAVGSDDPVAVQVVAVWFDLDFKARDADGRTALECARAPEVREMLLDAGADTRARDLALMMVFHARLGANAPMRMLETDIVLAMVLPHTSRVEDIREVREARLDALAEAEGLIVTRKARHDYVSDGAMFAPARFRIDHFLHTFATDLLVSLAELHTREVARAVLKRRLAWHGLRFEAPITPDYAEHAREVIAHPLSDEDNDDYWMFDNDDDDDE